MNWNGIETLATGGTCELSGSWIVGVARASRLQHNNAIKGASKDIVLRERSSYIARRRLRIYLWSSVDHSWLKTSTTRAVGKQDEQMEQMLRSHGEGEAGRET